MKRSVIVTVIVVVGTLIGLLVFNSITSGGEKDSHFAEAVKGDFEISLSSSGELLPENSIDIKAPEVSRGRDFRASELEITDINNYYLKQGQLRVELLGRGFAWLDTGTHESLLEASTFIETIEKRQGQQVACIEEIAYLLGYIDTDQVHKLAEPLMKNSYGQYLLRIIG